MVNEKQREAVELICGSEEKVLLTGAPGTGKSYTIAQAVKILMNNNKVVIACPSHKAKGVVSEMLDEQEIPHTIDSGEGTVSVMTIHKYLGYTLEDGSMKPDGKGGLNQVRPPMECDVLFLEEYSMLTKKFQVQAEETAEKIVLVGDIDQLPPILKKGEEAADISDYEMVELTEQMRQNALDTSLYKTIAAYRAQIRSGTPFSRFPDDDTLIANNDLISAYINGDIDIIIAFKNNIVDLINHSIQVKKYDTVYPVEGNTLILQEPLKEFSNFGSPIIVANNGEEIECLSDGEPLERDNRVYKVETDYGERWIFPHYINPYQWGKQYNMNWNILRTLAVKAKLPYCITAHKSQGSSYNNVGIALNDLLSAPLNIRARLLYVAFSRAKTSAHYTPPRR